MKVIDEEVAQQIHAGASIYQGSSADIYNIISAGYKSLTGQLTNEIRQQLVDNKRAPYGCT